MISLPLGTPRSSKRGSCGSRDTGTLLKRSRSLFRTISASSSSSLAVEPAQTFLDVSKTEISDTVSMRDVFSDRRVRMGCVRKRPIRTLSLMSTYGHPVRDWFDRVRTALEQRSKRESPTHAGLSKAGATGLEPATSGVTGELEAFVPFRLIAAKPHGCAVLESSGLNQVGEVFRLVAPARFHRVSIAARRDHEACLRWQRRCLSKTARRRRPPGAPVAQRVR
jgi:hypothetical protein